MEEWFQFVMSKSFTGWFVVFNITTFKYYTLLIRLKIKKQQ